MLVARIATGPKSIGSTEAMIRTEKSSPLYSGWVASSDEDFRCATQAVLERDLQTLGTVMEASTLRMHATMQKAIPPIQYWTPATREAMRIVEQLRSEGLSCWFTMDAGPNVKVLCTAFDSKRVASALQVCCEGVDILGAGPDAHLL
jgi:diphosphomevalonate decarboxylase